MAWHGSWRRRCLLLERPAVTEPSIPIGKHSTNNPTVVEGNRYYRSPHDARDAVADTHAPTSSQRPLLDEATQACRIVGRGLGSGRRPDARAARPQIDVIQRGSQHFREFSTTPAPRDRSWVARVRDLCRANSRPTTEAATGRPKRCASAARIGDRKQDEPSRLLGPLGPRGEAPTATQSSAGIHFIGVAPDVPGKESAILPMEFLSQGGKLLCAGDVPEIRVASETV